MKTLHFLYLGLLGATLLAVPSRAQEPRALTLTPNVEAMLKDLLKSTDSGGASEAAPSTPAAPPVKAPTPAPTASSKTGVASPTSLRTSSLSTSSLTPSGGLATSSLGGHGLQGGTPRLNDTDWRALFPQAGGRK